MPTKKQYVDVLLFISRMVKKNDITLLTHVEHPLRGGGAVLVLNTGAVIHPESEAMLQALHSRSIGGIREHLSVLQEKGSEKFMSTYYVGYGHKSIGDCGSATVFVEGVSMLAAKAIQDWPLYSGQESSTRYINFQTQPFVNPLGTVAGVRIQEAWRDFYLTGIQELNTSLQERFPIGEDESPLLYKKAISARSFDIMRAFLPAGATTNIAWHMNLRQFADTLPLLRHHPLEEVQEIAKVVEETLLDAFPHSFSTKRYENTEAYYAKTQTQYYHTDPSCPHFELSSNTLNNKLLCTYSTALRERPEKTELPRHIAECGTLQFRFLLDFGSFRDIQRHRAVTQRMPLLTDTHGFHEWYLSELPNHLKNQALSLIHRQQKEISALKTTPEIAQYYIAMGFRVPNRLTGDLRALVYLAELRGTRFVHSTLREHAWNIARTLKEVCKEYALALHMDSEPDRFDVQRGAHDIMKKTSD